MPLVACGADADSEAAQEPDEPREPDDADDPIVPVVRETRDVGAVCLSARAEGGTFIQVVLDYCASYCADVEASCSFEVDGSVIHLTASGKEVRDTSGNDCPTACQQITAQCSLPAGLEGTQELRYGDRSTPIELPVEGRRREVLSGSSPSDCAAAPAPQ